MVDVRGVCFTKRRIRKQWICPIYEVYTQYLTLHNTKYQAAHFH